MRQEGRRTAGGGGFQLVLLGKHLSRSPSLTA
nr:MAG TPA: hypothetical protein [Bacteriophage sp.]